MRYSIDEVSYWNQEDRRVLKTCLANWFQSPKILNFVAPSMTFPFKFSTWVNYYRKYSGITTFVVKEKDWIVGHISLHFDKTTKIAHLFHLFVDSEYRRQGLAEKMITAMENHGSNLGAVSFSIIIVPKNNPARILYEKSGYQKEGIVRSGWIKYSKINLAYHPTSNSGAFSN